MPIPRTSVTTRLAAVIGGVTAGAMLLAACGSDDNQVSSPVDVGAADIDCTGAAELSGAGSSAQKNAMDQFTAAYIAACAAQGEDVRVAYTASGSGDGRTQFVAGQVDFAGSDSPIEGDQLVEAQQRCEAGEVWNLPLVFGPVALAYNLGGVDDLVLDAATTARIFDGSVERWNDPAIAALNPDAELPDTEIEVIHRSDSSGTTDNFQQYLSVAAPQVWDRGAGSDFVGGVGNGAKGSAGVAQAVGAAPGSITYVEQSFADQAGLAIARIDNGSGPVELTSQTAGAAIAAAEFAAPGGQDLTLDLTSIYGTDAADAYPLVLATYEVVCGAGYDADTAAAVTDFLTVAAGPGQQGLAELGYVPLPEPMRDALTASIDAISAR